MSRRVTSWLPAALLVAVAAVGAGSAGCGAGAQRDLLMESVQTYNEGVRWERFTAAAAVVPPAEREDFLDERESLADDLRITDIEVVRVARLASDRTDVQVKLSWYLESRGTVNETWARQRWERRGPAWRLVDERRVRGDEMPGLAERVDEDDATAAAHPD